MYKIFGPISIFYALDTFIEIRRAVPPFAMVSSAAASLFSGSAAPVVLPHLIAVAGPSWICCLICAFLTYIG